MEASPGARLVANPARKVAAASVAAAKTALGEAKAALKGVPAKAPHNELGPKAKRAKPALAARALQMVCRLLAYNAERHYWRKNPLCRFRCHRDAVGSVNILQLATHGGVHPNRRGHRSPRHVLRGCRALVPGPEQGTPQGAAPKGQSPE